MADHPLYLKPVLLSDGREGTVVEVHDGGAAFMVELVGATSLDDLITVYPADIAGLEGILARAHPTTTFIDQHGFEAAEEAGLIVNLSKLTREEMMAWLRGRGGE